MFNIYIFNICEVEKIENLKSENTVSETLVNRFCEKVCSDCLTHA